ncbi:hypothetical protein FRC19_000663 [Serendipita sp. 401]|nr:hypothetical protein FRC19_000663 [Serendipita sp. 401]KAG8835748.1 hypothetical protein FRC18_012369 [Serendipita sp. 400]KAG9056050.1 hypothetical protein FS842_000442 [Serendipita sp. 407]
MSKSAKGAAAAKLVQDATSAPGVYVFAQLLDQQNVRELQNIPNHRGSYDLLEIFAHGTYQDYKTNTAALPPLNTAQLTKLKYLSLASMATQSRILGYGQLLSALDISSIRELEDLIIDAIYQDIVRGKLDQKEQQFEVEFTMGRDLQMSQLPSLLEELRQWSQRTAGVIAALDKKIEGVMQQEKNAKLSLEQHEAQREAMIQEIQAKSKKGRAEKDAAEDTMELDDMPNSGGSTLGSLLGFGNKRNKPPSTGPGGMFRKRTRA